MVDFWTLGAIMFEMYVGNTNNIFIKNNNKSYY